MLITQESSVFDTTLFLTSQSAACMLGMFSLDKIMPQYVNIWDRFREKGPSAYYKICYKNALRLNRYNFRTVNAIDFLQHFIAHHFCM